MSLPLRVAANPFDFEPMWQAGIEEWVGTSEGRIDGVPVAPRVARDLFPSALSDGRCELLLIGEPIAGCGIVAMVNGWIEGLVLYILPERRGEKLCEPHFASVVDLARQRGLKGFRFFSTLPWLPRGTMTRDLHVMQKDGTAVYLYQGVA